MARTPRAPGDIENYSHDDKRRMIPTAEQQGFVEEDEARPKTLVYPRDTTLDPQLVWRGKDAEDQSDLYVDAPPIYIQEKIHPRAIIERLKKDTSAREAEADEQVDLFADFNGRPEELEARTEFYAHDQNWQNRLILGDALMVMASLAEREGLRGKVQCIYMDPPYGIKFNSNWQTRTNNRDVKDGAADHVSREPEVIRAFRDTWKDGVNTYLSYLRDRLVLARDLLTESGSIFVQIGDENVHLIRSLLDEVFGSGCFLSEILVKKKGSQKSSMIDPVNDYILWYGKKERAAGAAKYRALYEDRPYDSETLDEFSRAELPDGSIVNLKDYQDADGEKLDFRVYPARLHVELPGARVFRPWPITNGGQRARQMDPVHLDGTDILPPKGRCWSHTSQAVESGLNGMGRNKAAGRLVSSRTSLDFKRYLDDFPYKSISNWWDGFGGASNQVYVVQTNERIIQRCLLMATDPGDLVLDPTCGSGTTAYVAEQWGRRWITIDTSRVALTLARQRIMAARYPYYLLQDSREGWEKENSLRPSSQQRALPARFGADIRQGFVLRRANYVTSGQIANNADIDAIWENWQKTLEPLRDALNTARKTTWEEWEIPRLTIWDKKAGESVANPELKDWPEDHLETLRKWWEARRTRQSEIDTSIERNADVELLYDRPYEDKKTVRVAGPFTVESLSPYRVIPSAEDPALLAALEDETGDLPKRTVLSQQTDFATVVMEHLKAAGVQNTKKGEAIRFDSLTPWAGRGYVAYEGRYERSGKTIRAAISIGPEYDAVGYEFVRAAAREAADYFDELIVCGFQFTPDVDESRLNFGRLTVMKARMNQDIRMGDKLKNTGAGNLFVVFGEPDIDVREVEGGLIEVEIKGVDIFDPTTGEVKSSNDPADDIAAWFIDDQYDEESFYVRHAYFLGGASGDPYKALKRALKAEIDEDAWATLHSTVSRPFARPKDGRICIKVINHFGDEVQKVFDV